MYVLCDDGDDHTSDRVPLFISSICLGFHSYIEPGINLYNELPEVMPEFEDCLSDITIIGPNDQKVFRAITMREAIQVLILYARALCLRAGYTYEPYDALEAFLLENDWNSMCDLQKPSHF